MWATQKLFVDFTNSGIEYHVLSQDDFGETQTAGEDYSPLEWHDTEATRRSLSH